MRMVTETAKKTRTHNGGESKDQKKDENLDTDVNKNYLVIKIFIHEKTNYRLLINPIPILRPSHKNLKAAEDCHLT